MSSRRGLSRWLPISVPPVREGDYECIVQISRSVPAIRWRLTWDRRGFRVPCPMIVHHWRGQTRRAVIAAARSKGSAP